MHRVNYKKLWVIYFVVVCYYVMIILFPSLLPYVDSMVSVKHASSKISFMEYDEKHVSSAGK